MNHMSTVEARKIARELFEAHGLVGWRLTLDGARRRAGQCQYGPKVISLSYPLLHERSYEDSLNTITHEIAHAIVGHEHGHDAVWARKHRELGGTGTRTFNHDHKASPWVGICGHGKEFPRYRQPKRLDGWRCRCAAGATTIQWGRRRSSL